MQQVFQRVFVAGDDDCRTGNARLAVVHACKYPCHQKAVGGYDGLTDANWLVFERGQDLFLNLIDPSTPLFCVESFTRFLAFAKAHYGRGESLLIHCNRGESRSPSLALLFLAKGLGEITAETFEAAKAAYQKLCPWYVPGEGIRDFLTAHWDEI